MSLVPTWVQAEDGKFYKNPILSGRGWFLCFDDSEPPEFVVSVPTRSVAEEVLTRELRVPHRVTSARVRGQRLFPPAWDEFRDAVGLFLALDGPIPVPGQHEGVSDGVPDEDCVVFRWK